MKTLICGLLVGISVACLGGRSDAYDMIQAGEKLSPDEVEQLEKQLVEDSQDRVARKKLLGYYWQRQRRDTKAKSARQRHVLWMIANAPEDEIHSMPYCQLNKWMDGERYAQGREAWLKQIGAAPENTDIRGNAANYLLLADRDLAEEQLLEAPRLDPKNPEWPKRLGQIYSLDRKNSTDDSGQKAALKALGQLEQAYALSPLPTRGYLMADMAKTAAAAGKYDTAKAYAKKMVALPGLDWNSGNNVHHGNMVLGLVALHEDDVAAAKGFLIASGKTKGSPQLNSFGPNMTLAKALLEKGETEVVLEYFDLCSKFWKMHRGRLDEWSALAKEGLVPDFGANLAY